MINLMSQIRNVNQRRFFAFTGYLIPVSSNPTRQSGQRRQVGSSLPVVKPHPVHWDGPELLSSG